MHIAFSLSPHLKQSLYVRITLSLPNGWRTLDKHGVCVVVTWRAADSAGAWIMDSWLASVWSGLLLLPTSFCCSPYKAGTHPACHMEPILLTQPNCPWPRALTPTVLSTFHPSSHLLCIPSQGGEVPGTLGSEAASQKWPSKHSEAQAGARPNWYKVVPIKVP